MPQRPELSFNVHSAPKTTAAAANGPLCRNQRKSGPVAAKQIGANRNAVHLVPLSREAAPDRSLRVERSGTLGRNHRGRSPARGAGKQTCDSDNDRVAPNEGHQLEQPKSAPKLLTEQYQR